MMFSGDRTLQDLCYDPSSLGSTLAAEENAGIDTDKPRPRPEFSVLNYNVLAQRDASIRKIPHCPEHSLKWVFRRARLMEEIIAYDADILCLQEVEYFQDFWHPALSKAGYDCIYHERTNERADGLVIGIRRSLFQLFKVKPINLNDVAQDFCDTNRNLATRLLQDNIGLLVMIQPWEISTFPTALCVVTAQLASEVSLEQVRTLQMTYLCREIEHVNADFQLPVVFTGSMNSAPNSDGYHIVLSGKTRPRPCAPSQASAPVEVEVTTSTIRIRWKAPSSEVCQMY